MLHLSSDGNFVHSSAGRPRILICPQTGYWAGPFFAHSLNIGQNWPTQASSAKLNEMLSIQKFASNRTGLGYGFSSSNIASTSTTVFVPSSNNVEIEKNDVKTNLASKNIDRGKSILGAPPKQDKKEGKNPAKKANSQKPKQKKQHLYHHCGVDGHTRPNCYNWLAT